MSCNGCRVLRKGCSDNCILRPCLQWIESAEAQGYATVFVAKFFGRAGLMSFISGVPDNQRPALFQSLMFEAAGRTVNPVNGAVGLLWTGNWHVCQAAVETVLRGGTLRPIPELLVGGGGDSFGGSSETDEASDCTTGIFIKLPQNHRPTPRGGGSSSSSPNGRSNSKAQKRRRSQEEQGKVMQLADLDLSLTPGFQNKSGNPFPEKRRIGSSSMNSEESVTTTCFDRDQEPTLLKLFN